MTDPYANIPYPSRSGAPNITNTMQPTIDAIGARVSVAVGTEGVLAGSAPSAKTAIRTRSWTVTQTTAADGTMTVAVPGTAPTGLVAAHLQNALAGTNLSFTIDKAATTTSAIKVKVYFAADSSLYASASATFCVTVMYW